ncbi:DUF4190 domain-containing protein [Streptomyces sp. NPDC101166]|uniref:DUF4190 domain-containing protein n=1 Tax=Streptomyces sp. NPDC101166 TaxID=3366120 RepID=UPI003823C9D7
MSDDAPTPAGQGEAAASRPDAADDAVHSPWAAPGSVPEGAEGPQYALAEEPSDGHTGPQDAEPTPRVPLTKPDGGALTAADGDARPVADAKPVTEGSSSASSAAPSSGPWPEPAVGSERGTDTTVVFPEEPVSSPEAPAAPSPHTVPQAEDRRAEESPAEEPQPFAPRDQVPPSVHQQPTVASLPGAEGNPAQAGPPPWADPFGPPAYRPVPTHAPTSTPPASALFAAFPPPDPATLAGGPPPGIDPFAPPAGGAVPPPPIAPGGPGPMPYGYPGGYGHQGAPAGYGHHGSPAGYGGGLPAYYGWNGMRPPSNGMGLAAMVLGIVAAVGICLWPAPLLIGPLAVVFGLIGRSKAKRGEANNAGQALAGIICGLTGFVLAAVVLVLFIVGQVRP